MAANVNNRFLKYSIDHLNSEHVSGWCFNSLRKSKPVKLTFCLDGFVMGATVADSYREDVKSHRLHPNGLCGFDFQFPTARSFRGAGNVAIYAGNARSPFQSFPADQIPQVLKGRLPRIFFMHIPKTGGTTLNAFAVQYFPTGTTATHIEALSPDLYPQLGAEKNYLAGHLSLHKICEGFDVSSYDLVSMLRDPYRQLHSHLSWIRRIAANRESGFFLKHEKVVRELAVRLHETDLTINANLKSLVDQAQGFELDFFDNLQTRYFLRYRPERVGNAELRKAQENVGMFKLIGTTERCDELLDRFCDRYGMGRVSRARSFNRSALQLFDCDDKAVRSILTPFVESDLSLYQYVTTLSS